MMTIIIIIIGMAMQYSVYLLIIILLNIIIERKLLNMT